MITRIHIDGFKSLSNISLYLNSGINILVRPNGSEKTNIITFFSFLSNLMSESVGDAVSHAGGAGTLFRKLGEEEYSSEIEAYIEGWSYPSTLIFSRKYRKNTRIYYKYNFTIKLTDERDYIFFKEQRIRVLLTQRSIPKNEISKRIDQNSNLDILISCDNIGDPEFEIRRLSMKRIEVRLALLSRYFAGKDRLSFFDETHSKLSTKKIKPGLEKYLSATFSAARSIIASGHDVIPALRVLEFELRTGNVLNIEPNQIKKPEDGANPPGIRADGSGVASTLYYLKERKEQPNSQRPTFFRRRYGITNFRIRSSSNTFDQIVSYIKLVNPLIENIVVKNDRFDNLLSVIFHISGEEKPTELPFSVMSDGTVKWIALVTAILTSPSILAIEEPENYIHPLMQKEILNIIRTHTDPNNFILLSTHSETLLNAADPGELIIVSMENGKTKASRPKNQENIRKIINEEGFGLGFFYITGALNDA